MATTLRLSPELQARVKETAAREQRSEHAVIVEAIERYTSERDRRRDAALARVLERDKPILDALA
ncbi:ribbon-helix-helix domain-containing protein [Cellulomonas sp. NS3]|uniref:ribbon-helix-helix domain-containing protein n=1 Tax=Cellulomonas sp. NS3 TaxID=2973977 RepID=UPI002162BEB6|nr:ribbon-helix-helix domain-containing protein [Cellulomonas sp. NS3]